jgi:hypothetical protein
LQNSQGVAEAELGPPGRSESIGVEMPQRGPLALGQNQIAEDIPPAIDAGSGRWH